MKSFALCQICKEPIWNFLCIDCLESHIKRWLPVRLAHEFDKFHHTFSKHFRSMFSEPEYCMHCKSHKNKPVCPYCYTNEVYHWLKVRDRNLAGRFITLFFFDFERTGFRDPVKMDNLTPITEDIDVETEFGICDECGEYSEELHHADCGWVCKACWGVE
jgi:hypothetical protein